jgi:hypothetical protein
VVGKPHSITVNTERTTTTAALVVIRDAATGVLAEVPFHLNVTCGATALNAVVDANGRKVRGPRAVASFKANPGHYDVIFDRRVDTCAINATIGGIDGTSVESGLIHVGFRNGDPKGFAVRTFDRAGNPADRSFHVNVTCGQAKPWAVVDANGSLLNDGTPARSSTVLGVDGNYSVSFDRDVRGCAYIATPFNPFGAAAVFASVAQRAGDPNGVFVASRDLASNRKAHRFGLTVVC